MRPYTHLTTEERACLSEYWREGKNDSEIARLLNRSPSTISRERKRNRNKNVGRNGTDYDPIVATNRYKNRRRKCIRQPRLLPGSAVFLYAWEKLQRTWSPEEIVLTWKKEHPGEKLSANTIYRAIKSGALPGIAACTHLRRKGKKKYGKRKKFNTIKPEHTIHDRPEVVEKRERVGDWEGDTVAGGVGKGYLITLVERCLRRLVVAKVNTLNAAVVADATIRALRESGLPVLTITFDNGSEFACYKKIEEELQATVYFADPHSPWQRGCNESYNDRLRFFFPKGSDLRSVPDEIISQAVSLINERPRKCLGLRSPSSLANFLHLT